MQAPVFGQNPALAAARSAPAPKTLAAAGPVAPGAPAGSEPVLPSSKPAVPVPPTDPKARAPMGFLEMARAIQSRNENAAHDSPGLGPGLFGEDGFDFGDVLDVINPLQHIPIVSTLYRAVTGDTIAAGPRMAGGGLFGGPFGFLSAAVNAAIEEQTGNDIGDHVRYALLGEPEAVEQEPVMFASADVQASGKENAAAAQTMTAGLDAPQSAPKLTPEQVQLLNQYEDEGEAAAAVMPAAGPGVPPAGPEAPPVRELTPAQEELLLRSLGLSPETKTPAAPDAPESDSVLTGDVAPEAVADETPKPEVAAAPRPPVNVAPLPRGPAPAGDPDFAERMQYGLERYFEHPTPQNPEPPRLDERW